MGSIKRKGVPSGGAKCKVSKGRKGVGDEEVREKERMMSGEVPSLWGKGMRLYDHLPIADQVIPD